MKKQCSEVSVDCVLRHEQQDRLVKSVSTIEKALVGDPMSQEDSLVAKVNVIFGNMEKNEKYKQWLITGFLLFAVGLIFNAGVSYNRLETLENQTKENTKNIEVIMKQLKIEHKD